MRGVLIRLAFVTFAHRSPNNVTTRSISRVVPATKGKDIARLIGTVDVDGKGTTHSLEEVDPFILLDQGTIGKTNTPPFGAHPHRGHSVVTILLRGKVRSWDSFSRKQEWTTIQAPSSYWVDAGSGLFHDERSVVEDASDSTQHMSLLQLWVGVSEDDRKKAPKLQYDTNLPLVNCMDGDKIVGQARYYVGSETSIETPHPITVVHIKQHANTVLRFPIDPLHGGFVVNLNGSDMLNNSGPEESPACFGGTTPANPHGVLVLNHSEGDDATFLEVKTKDGEADYVVCVGERIQQSWAKKLVANGAIIAATPEEARSIATNVEKYAQAGKSDGGTFAPFGV